LTVENRNLKGAYWTLLDQDLFFLISLDEKIIEMRKISHQKETFLPGETYPLTIDVNEA